MTLTTPNRPHLLSWGGGACWLYRCLTRHSHSERGRDSAILWLSEQQHVLASTCILSPIYICWPFVSSLGTELPEVEERWYDDAIFITWLCFSHPYNFLLLDLFLATPPLHYLDLGAWGGGGGEGGHHGLLTP